MGLISIELIIHNIKTDKELENVPLLQNSYLIIPEGEKLKWGKCCDCLGHINVLMPMEKEYEFRDDHYTNYHSNPDSEWDIEILGDRRF